MLTNKLRCLKNSVGFFVLVLFLLSFVSFALGRQDVDLEKKYADILGNWEVDLTDAGMGMLNVEFYIEDGALWVLPEMDEPGQMIPVEEGEEWKFTIDSEWELEFIKDGTGKYHKCIVINEAEGINTTAQKK